MIVIGIDPGTAIMGYGIVEFSGGRHKPVDYGVLRTDKDMKPEIRLRELFIGINRLLDGFKPDVMAVEELFFNRNTTNAISVGQARGVAMLAAGLRDMPVGEYTPLQVKQAVVGYGRAEKSQVQFMVRKLLSLPETPKPDDAADALAVAICYCQYGGKSSWRSG